MLCRNSLNCTIGNFNPERGFLLVEFLMASNTYKHRVGRDRTSNMPFYCKME